MDRSRGEAVPFGLKRNDTRGGHAGTHREASHARWDIGVSNPGRNSGGTGWGPHVVLLARMSRRVPWVHSRLLVDAGERNVTRRQVDPGAGRLRRVRASVATDRVDGVIEPPKLACDEADRVDRAALSWMQGLTTVHISNSLMMRASRRRIEPDASAPCLASRPAWQDSLHGSACRRRSVAPVCAALDAPVPRYGNRRTGMPHGPTTRHRRCARLRAEMLFHVRNDKYYIFKNNTIRRWNIRRHLTVGARATAIDAGWLGDPMPQPVRSPTGFIEEEAMSRTGARQSWRAFGNPCERDARRGPWWASSRSNATFGVVSHVLLRDGGRHVVTFKSNIEIR